MLSSYDPKRKLPEGVFDFYVCHIDGIIFGQGEISKDNLDEVNKGNDYLDKRLTEEGFYFGNDKRKSWITTKWKYDTFRIELANILPEDLNDYRNLLKDVALKYPAFASIMDYSPSMDKALVFTGTIKQYDDWEKNLKEPLEKIIEKTLNNKQS